MVGEAQPSERARNKLWNGQKKLQKGWHAFRAMWSERARNGVRSTIERPMLAPRIPTPCLGSPDFNWFRLGQVATLTVSGSPTLTPMTVTLETGWTWLPYPHQSSRSLNDGAPAFAYAVGNQFKSQTAFSEFYAGYGWFGTLNTLEQGRGYKLKVDTGGAAVFS